MKISKFQREKLPSGIEYFNVHGLTLRGTGEWRDSICFFHDDTNPSLRVKADCGAFKCLACGEHGSSTLDLHMKRMNLSFVQAAKELGAWEGSPISIPKPDLEAIKQAQEAIINIRYSALSKTAKSIFNNAPKASNDHAYLVRKKVKAYGIKQIRNELLIPIYSIDGEIQSIQFISDATEQNKRFLSGGKKKGGFHFIGEFDASKPIYIAEGYATAVSVYEDTGCFSLVAFDCGNLGTVARAFRAQLLDVEIVIAGDCDEAGMKCALEASKAVNGKAVFPDFGDNTEGLTDWNDYFNMGVSS